MVYAVVFLTLYALRGFSEPLIQPKKNKLRLFGKPKKGFISLLFLFLSSLISVLSVGYFLFRDGPDSLGLYVTGIVLFLAGLVGRAVSLKELGLNYSQDFRCVPNGHLVVTGVYSIIRHPIYLFYMVEMLAFFVIKQNYISLAALVVVALASLYRMKAEEKFLFQKFGNQFVAYREKTKRLIPFVF
jgi:protein-S-isoprenylcysteine O-methyltransferase Ste14